MRKLFFILLQSCFLLLPSWMLAQDSFVLPKSAERISFKELVQEVESNYELVFYFREEWVDSLYFEHVTAGSSLLELLDQTLPGQGLHYVMQSGKLILYRGEVLKLEIPEYGIHQEELNSEDPLSQSSDENSGIRTREIFKAPVFTIGSQQRNRANTICTVNGRVLNQNSKEELIGATIFVRELEKGLITDVHGNFSIKLRPGEYSLDINHMAMKESHVLLKVLSSGDFTVELEDDIIEIEEVVISDSRFDNVKSLQMGQNRISIKTMKEIPVVMGEKDILKVAQMLPGVQNVGEGASGINVRGGTPDQNMFYINHIPVYNTSHLFGFFTAFNPDVISDFVLYKNNIPAKYGGRIASVFEISTRNGHKDRFFAQGGISPITGHFSFEGPVVKDKVSVVGGFRSTYSDWLLKQVQDMELSESSASFYDGTLGINMDLNENNELKLFLYQSRDTFSLSQTNDYRYTNSGASLSWNHSFNTSLNSQFSLSSSEYAFATIDRSNPSAAYRQDFQIRHHEGRLDFLFLPFEKHRISFGGNTVLYQLDRGGISPWGSESNRLPIDLGMETGLENALYVSDEFSLGQHLKVLGGLRYSMYSYLGPSSVLYYADGFPREAETLNGSEDFPRGAVVRNWTNLEPRLALNYLITNENSVKASYNRISQYIFMLSNTIAVSPNDQWKLTDYHLRPPVADQLSAGYYHDLKDYGLSFSIELYKKWVKDVVDYKDGADFISGDPIEQSIIQGKQEASGVELLIKRENRKLTGWLSYTYSRSFIQMESIHPAETINGGEPYPSNYDRPHNLILAANYRYNKRFSFSGNLVYYTGRPITLPIGLYYLDDQELLIYSDRNEYRIPDYFRIDFSINIEGNLKNNKKGHSYWMLNVYNLTGRNNAYSVYYRVLNNSIKAYKLSVFPIPVFTISWHLKLGNLNSD